jgi:hypothetical protein
VPWVRHVNPVLPGNRCCSVHFVRTGLLSADHSLVAADNGIPLCWCQVSPAHQHQKYFRACRGRAAAAMRSRTARRSWRYYTLLNELRDATLASQRSRGSEPAVAPASGRPPCGPAAAASPDAMCMAAACVPAWVPAWITASAVTGASCGTCEPVPGSQTSGARLLAQIRIQPPDPSETKTLRKGTQDLASVGYLQ